MGRKVTASPEVIAKRATALSLRGGGATYPQIAKQMSCALSTAYDYVQEGLRDTMREPADRVRELELDRLDAMLKAIWTQIIDRNSTPQTKRLAIDRALAIMDRRARYLGLDAPVRRIVEVVTHDDFVKVMEGLERELAELESDDEPAAV